MKTNINNIEKLIYKNYGKDFYINNSNKSKEFINHEIYLSNIADKLIKKIHLLPLSKEFNPNSYQAALEIILGYKKIPLSIFVKYISYITKISLGLDFKKLGHNLKYRKYIINFIIYRTIETGNNNIIKYYNFIEKSFEEREILVTYLSPSTTYFFRDELDIEFEKIKNYINNDIVKVLIIGCSTGAETYSLKYLLEESKIQHFITSIDINKDAINYAHKGKYNMEIIDSLSPHIKSKLFTKNHISYKYKKNIEFLNNNIINLNNNIKYDLILARNVLKYFSLKNKNICLNKIYSILKKNGIIMLGKQNGSNMDILDINFNKDFTKIGSYTFYKL